MLDPILSCFIKDLSSISHVSLISPSLLGPYHYPENHYIFSDPKTKPAKAFPDTSSCSNYSLASLLSFIELLGELWIVLSLVPHLTLTLNLQHLRLSPHHSTDTASGWQWICVAKSKSHFFVLMSLDYWEAFDIVGEALLLFFFFNMYFLEIWPFNIF